MDLLMKNHETSHGFAFEQRVLRAKRDERETGGSFENFQQGFAFHPHKKALSVEIPKIKQEVVESGLNLKSHQRVKNEEVVRIPPVVILKQCRKRIKSHSGRYWNAPLNKFNLKTFDVKRTVLKPISLPEKDPQLAVSGKTSKLNRIIDDGIYFKLMEFYIKISLEFTPIFNKIDADKRNSISINEIKDYFHRIFPSFLNEILIFTKLIQSLTGSDPINKDNFLSSCAIVRYENPTGEAKMSILTVDYKKISSLLQVLNTIFVSVKNLPDPKLEILNINYSGSKEELEKCLKFVFDEPLNFSRFLRIFPLFLWLGFN